MDRIRRLEELAFPTPGEDQGSYEGWMRTAKREDMSYVEALEFVVRMRHGGAH